MFKEEFRRRAARCLQWAQDAANERTKALWLDMAQIWLNRADEPHFVANEGVAGRALVAGRFDEMGSAPSSRYLPS